MSGLTSLLLASLFCHRSRVQRRPERKGLSVVPEGRTYPTVYHAVCIQRLSYRLHGRGFFPRPLVVSSLLWTRTHIDTRVLLSHSSVTGERSLPGSPSLPHLCLFRLPVNGSGEGSGVGSRMAGSWILSVPDSSLGSTDVWSPILGQTRPRSPGKPELVNHLGQF